MFDIDVFNNLERLSIYLAKPSGELLGCLDDIIDDDSASLSIGLNQRYTLSFDVNLASKEDNLWYEYIQEGMYLFVPKVGLFKMNQPTTSMDDSKDVKAITAYSCDSELDDKTISLSLNMGTATSMEYLVEYDDDETESLLNPYTGIPYDWLVLYNTFPEQLTIEKEKYNQSYYGSVNSSGEIVVTDESLISELQTLFTLIPRLKSKIVTTTDDNGINDYSLTEYVIYEYGDGEDDVVSITLTSLYDGRIDELITFYTKYREQLSLLCVVLEKTDGNWSVGDIYGVSDGDYSLANKKYQFEADENIYSFLTNTLSQTINCIVDFDIVNRKVNVTPVDVIGNDTGIVLTYDNLMNTMDISCNEDILCTRLYVTGADDLTIEQVNFGLAYVDDIDYKINVRDSEGNRIYVSDDLAEKYTEYVDYRESLRNEYIQCSKDYNSYDSEISEIKYRVPNDSVQTDWSTYTLEELEAALTTYKNLLVALESLYKNDYGTAGLNSDGSINEDYIQQTMYWYDYSAYQTTISQIECAITVYPYYNDENNWSSSELAQYKDAVSAWETEWSLYGTVELQAKISTYEQNMEVLVDAGSVILDSDGIAVSWGNLTEEQQTEYSCLSSNYYYDTYMEYYSNMISAQEYLDTLLAQVAELEELQTTVQSRRTEIVELVTMTNYFTENECKILNRLFKESNYSNENILVTSLNDTVDSLDVMYELLEDGKEQASILSRPQLQFSIDADNLLGIPDFKPLWDDFKPGNYMMIQYRDDTYVKLRMTGYSFNPCLPSNNSLSLTFSNYIRSKTGLSDIESMLGLATSSSSSSSGSGSGSGGTYGESDDIDVTISNTMLAKLLNSETFGTRVTNIILDTLDVNAITARYATFNGLANGTTIIDGKCITTGYIVDFSYNGTDGSIDNTEGSVVNLETGQFSFAGGRLIWDGDTLKITGDGSGLDISTNNTISGLSSNISANTEGITSVAKSVSDLSSTLSTDYSTTTQVESMIKQSADEITSSITAVSKTVSDLSDNLSQNYSTTTTVQSIIDETADSITSSVSKLSETLSTDYSTTTQVQSMISETADSITSTVTSLSNNLSTNYSTTTQVESMIKQTADSISLSVENGTLGSSASIKLSVNGSTASTQTIDMTGVRNAFASDTSAITISAGTITFNSGTIVINGSNFSVTSAGAMSCSGATIGGAVTATSMTALNHYYIHNSSGTKLSALEALDADFGATLDVGDGFSAVHTNGRLVTGGDIYAAEDWSGSVWCTKVYCTRINSGGSLCISDGTNIAYINDAAQKIEFKASGEAYYGVALWVDNRVTAWTFSPSDDSSTYYDADYDVYVSTPHVALGTAAHPWSSLRCTGAIYCGTGGTVVTHTAGTAVGSGSSPYLPVYISSTGVATACYINVLYQNGTTTAGVLCGTGGFRVTTSTGSGNLTLGTSSYKWGTIYATSSTISTSDERVKTDIVDIDEAYETLFMKLRGVNYKYKNFTDDDNHDRIHCGLIAQEVKAAMMDVGLTSVEFATLCYDELEDGCRPDGRTDEYGIAYGELHGLEIHMIQKNVYAIESLSSNLLSVDSRLTIAESEITNLQNELSEAKETIRLLTEQLQASA